MHTQLSKYNHSNKLPFKNVPCTTYVLRRVYLYENKFTDNQLTVNSSSINGKQINLSILILSAYRFTVTLSMNCTIVTCLILYFSNTSSTEWVDVQCSF